MIKITFILSKLRTLPTNRVGSSQIRDLTSHTTVRTGRYTAVQSHKCMNSQQPWILKYPAAASLSLVMEHDSSGLPAMRQ